MSTFAYAWGTPGSHPNDVPQEPFVVPANRRSDRRWAIIHEDEENDTRVEHEYFLRDRSSSAPIFSLRCKSRAISHNNKPVFFDGDSIEGGVQLMVHRSTHVEEVLLIIRGRISPPETGRPDIFWSTTRSLWKAPRKSFFKSLTGSGARLPSGNYSWDFALQLPLEVKVDTNSDVKVYPLPPSYRKTAPSAVLEYEILVTAYRGLMLEAHEIRVPFVFLPRSSPQHPFGKPLYRSDDTTPTTLTRSQHSSIAPAYPGGAEDYWSDSCMTIEGTIYANRIVQVQCRVIFKKPLIYPRGHPIYITIFLASDDSQALDLIANPQHVSLNLEQKTVVAGDQVWEDVLATGGCIVSKETQGPTIRRLSACVTCPREVKPSFSFITFTLQHFLVLRFKPTAFFVPTNKYVPPIVQSIQIVTDRILPP